MAVLAGVATIPAIASAAQTAAPPGEAGIPGKTAFATTASPDSGGGDLRPRVGGCPVCDLWSRYEPVVLQARQEVGKLENGVIYFFHADDPSVIEPLIRFAYEREEMETKVASDPSVRRRLGHVCGHDLLGSGRVRLQISTGAHGFFAILTSTDSTTVRMLQEEASKAARGRLVRF